MADCDRQYFSLNRLDEQLERYLDFDNGIFFEAGANDGIRQSNTLYFERYRGWSGILVEPIPQRFTSCRRNRPTARCFWGALTPEIWEDPFVALTFCDLMTVTQHESTAHLIDHHVNSGIPFLEDGQMPVTIHAPAMTINSILEQAGIDKVDLLSLDVERFEIPVLSGLNLERFDIRALCVESCNQPELSEILGGKYRLETQLSEFDFLYLKNS